MTINKETYETAIAKSRELIDRLGLPKPARNIAEKEYTYPTDPAATSLDAMGKLMFQLSGWSGYARRVLAQQDSEYGILESVFKVILSVEAKKKAEQIEGKWVKDQVEAIAIDESPILTELWSKMLEKKSFIDILKTQVDIYDKQHAGLSRELERRKMDQR